MYKGPQQVSAERKVLLPLGDSLPHCVLGVWSGVGDPMAEEEEHSAAGGVSSSGLPARLLALS